jgi:hypothetical protein
MTLGQNFPVSDYYQDHILDAETISRVGGWWTAVLLIEDPKSKKPFLTLYRWQKNENGWKLRKQFTFRTSEQVSQIFAVAERLGKKLEKSDD